MDPLDSTTFGKAKMEVISIIIIDKLLKAHWVEVPCKSPWSARQGHAAAVLGGAIYVVGGFDSSGYCNTAYRLDINRKGMNSLLWFILILLCSIGRTKEEIFGW